MKQEYIIDIDVAYNGFEGYNKAVLKNYDLVVCDLNMPVMDGFQFCTNFIKYFDDKNNFFDPNQEENKPKYRPYLIALSALVNNEIEQRAIFSGFDIVIEAPLR